jgi:hypothetical protein
VAAFAAFPPLPRTRLWCATARSAARRAVPPGPDDLGQADYLIRADLGKQRGGNLFHSFSKFSIGSGERATFTDQGAPNPGAIDNVIRA